MPEFKAGRAYIEVAPSLKGFRRKTESELNSELATAGEKAGERLGRNITDGAEKGASGAGRRSADKFAGEFDKQVRSRITAALKSLPEAQIGAATTEAEQKIRDLREKLLSLSDKRIGIDVDAAEAIAQINSIREEMNSIDGDTLKIDARINTAAAMAELDKLKVETARVDGDDINIDVNVDTGAAHANLTALQAHAAETAMSISGIALAIGLLGPALIPLAAGGTVALAGLGGAAVGAAGGLGVAAGALVPVVAGVQALGAADAASGKASAAAAKQREAAAQRTEQAGQRVADAARSVRDAEESAARSVSDAQERLAQVREQAAARVESALRSVGDAEARLAATQRESLAAQQAINGAREDARRALEDLSLNLADAQLRERESVIALADAKKTLDRTTGNPRATDDQRMRAQLGYDQAAQSLLEIQVQTKRLTAEKAAADKKGVDGSDQVVKAQQRAADAAENVRGAERDVADARKAAVKAERDGARDIARAARDVARAQEAGAKQVAAAHLSLARAQQAYAESLKQTGTTGSAAMDKLKQAMKNLSPEGQTFARYIFGLKDGFVELSKIAQRGFLPGLMDGMKSLGGYAGLLKDTVGELSTVLGNLARDAGKALTGPFWQQFFKFLSANAPGWLETFGKIMGAAATGMAALFQALSPVVDMMGEGTLKMFERFADWAKGLGKDKGFQQFLAYLKENGPKVAAFLSAFAGAVWNIVVALAPFGTGVLDTLTKGLKWISEQDPNTIQAIATSVLAVAGGMKALSIATGLVNAALALGPWGWIAVAIVAVGAALVYLYQTNADFKKKVDEIWQQIKDIFAGAVASIQQFWKEHGEQIKAEWERIWGSIKDTFSSVWKSIQDIVRSVGGWIQTFWQNWGDRLKAYFSTVWEGIKYIIDGALQVIRGIFEFFAGLFTGDWSRMWNGLTEVFNGVAKVLWGAIKTAFATVKLIIEMALSAIKTVWGKTWGVMTEGFSKFWDGLVDILRGPLDRVMQFIQENLIDKINGLFEFLHIPVHITPIWKAGNVGTGQANAGRRNPKNKKMFKDGGYTGNAAPWQAAGIVHGREFVMDATTTALVGPAGMEGIREAIRNGWKPQGYKSGGYVNPVGRAPSFPWGQYPSGGRHPAFDYAVPVGTPVRSPYSGTVIRDGWDTTGYGTSIRGRSDDGIFFVLGHMMRELVSVGQHVLAGQLVGYSGNTGNSSGPHLHFGTSHTPNMIAGAFNPDTGGGSAGGGNFVTDTLAALLTAGVGGITSLVSSGLSGLGFFGQLLGGVVKSLGTGVVNFGLGMLGIDSGGPYPGASDSPAPVKPLLFDSGGYLPTGISVVKNATGRPEPLMRMDGKGGPFDMQALATLIREGGGDTFIAHGIGDDAIQQAIRQKEFRQMSRLAI